MKSKNKTVQKKVEKSRSYVQKQQPPTKKIQTKSKATVAIETSKPHVETFDVGSLNYDSTKVTSDFINLVAKLREEYLGMVLQHQASRTAISQVMTITETEFGAPFVDFDDDFDEGIADIFKIMFFRNMITTLNKKYHDDYPIDVQAIIQLLFFPKTVAPPEVPVSPSVKKLSKQIEQLSKFFAREPQSGFYGLNGERNDQSRTKR